MTIEYSNWPMPERVWASRMVTRAYTRQQVIVHSDEGGTGRVEIETAGAPTMYLLDAFTDNGDAFSTVLTSTELLELAHHILTMLATDDRKQVITDGENRRTEAH